MNDENLIPLNRRTKSEQREIQSAGGKASADARRKRADFRKTLNALLTGSVEIDGLSDALRGCGVDSTYETIINMAMIQKAMTGDVRAYEAIAKYAGQSSKTEADITNRKADTELKQARKQAVTGENETDEALQKLDEILKGVYDNAVKQETE